MTLPVSSHTYRVRQLPAHMDRLQSTALLVQLLDGIEVEILSIAPAVNPWESPPTKVATAKFKTVPNRFTDGETEWVLSTRSVGLPQNILVDVHFWDLTVLNYVNTAEHQLDCIAISGLASHPFGSWKSRAADSNFMWLRDGLPINLPNIRSIIYGYDTKLLLSQSFQTIDDIAIALVLKLKSIRRSAHSAKPLCFLVHSLGGLIFKRAMVILANGGYAEHIILASIRSVIFFGVPSKGMHMSQLLPMVAGNPNETLIKQLSPGSEYLRNLEEQFAGISHLKKMRLISVYETEHSRTTQQLPSGEWDRSGPYALLVDKASAIHPDCTLTDTFPINRDHSGLVKFSENDSNYRGILIYLHEIVQNIVAERQCFSPATNITASEFEWSFAKFDYQSSSNPSRIPILSPKNTQNRKKSAEIEDVDVEEQIYTMISDLQSEGLGFRIQNIEDAFEATFHWIYNDSSLGFADWLRNGVGLYWINGKPGSGKSTLMKYICNNPKTSAALARCKQPGRQILANFFFFNRGTPLQKSFEGLLRSIIHQIITTEPALQTVALSAFSKSGSIWTLHSLEAAFDSILRQESSPVHIHLFLDALDEYDGSLDLVCKFIKSIANKTYKSATEIQVCFSSRPWNIFVDNFSSYPQLSIQEHTRQDMADYIDAKIKENIVLERVMSAESPLFFVSTSSLREELIEKAEGVFLWVNLTIVSLSRAATDGASSEEVARILSDIPEVLEGLYTQIVARTDSVNRHECYIMLEIALRSFEPLGLADFLIAFACARKQSIQDCLSLIPKRYPSREELDNMSRCIRSRCGGLLEIIKDDGKYTVNFMHQTVKEFAGKPSFQQLAVGNDYFLNAENGFSFLSKYTLALCVSQRTSYLEDSSLQQSIDDDCLAYARLAETSTGKSRSELFQGTSDLIIREHYETESSRLPQGISTHYPINSIMAFGVVANLKLFIKERLQETGLVNSNPVLSLLHCAVIAAVHTYWLIGERRTVQTPSDMIQLLLDHGANDDVIFDGLTPFQTLIYEYSRIIDFKDFSTTVIPRRLSQIALKFLERGENHLRPVKISIQGQAVPCTPAHVAAYLWHSPDSIFILKRLLAKGIEVNALDGRNLTALDVTLITVRRVKSRIYVPAELESLYSIVMLLINAGGRVTQKGFGARHSTLTQLEGRYDVEPIRNVSLLESGSESGKQNTPSTQPEFSQAAQQNASTGSPAQNLPPASFGRPVEIQRQRQREANSSRHGFSGAFHKIFKKSRKHQ